MAEYIPESPAHYRYNLRHPWIGRYYQRCREKLGLPTWCPLSDDQRHTFERYMDEKFKGCSPATGIYNSMPWTVKWLLANGESVKNGQEKTDS